MSGTPLQYSEDPEVLEIIDLDLNFDLRTVADRTGYPVVRYQTQPWRSQTEIAFPPCPDADCQGLEMARRLVKGGKIYVAGTGQNGPGPCPPLPINPPSPSGGQ